MFIVVTRDGSIQYSGSISVWYWSKFQEQTFLKKTPIARPIWYLCANSKLNSEQFAVNRDTIVSGAADQVIVEVSIWHENVLSNHT